MNLDRLRPYIRAALYGSMLATAVLIAGHALLTW